MWRRDEFALRCSLIGMGKLIDGFNVSVDGYIADAQGSIDWSDPSEELHQYWNDFERETALSFYGRRIYELMSAYWPTADKTPDANPLIVDFAHIWRDMPKVVFSRTLESVDWNSRLERGDPVEVVTKLKAETDGRLEVAGATLAAPIVQAGLVDEYRIVVSPTAVGGGTPFFPTLPSWISLRLLENRTFPGGTVLLRYGRNTTDRTHSQTTCGCTTSYTTRAAPTGPPQTRSSTSLDNISVEPCEMPASSARLSRRAETGRPTLRSRFMTEGAPGPASAQAQAGEMAPLDVAGSGVLPPVAAECADFSGCSSGGALFGIAVGSRVMVHPTGSRVEPAHAAGCVPGQADRSVLGWAPSRW